MNSFVFSLKNNDNLEPFKASMYDRLPIYNYSGIGANFGYGHDFFISDNAYSISNSCANLGYTYQLSAGYTPNAANTQARLAGSHYFTPSEVEVFYLQ